MKKSYTLYIISVVYRFVLKIRELLYLAGFFGSKRLPAKVISVGNITTGGTGKTPMVEYIAGITGTRSTAILSRGYKRKNPGKLVVVYEDTDPAISGDEAYLLREKLKIPVVLSADRNKSGTYAIRELGKNTLILDDGFQRRYSLKRDLDIVLVDATNPFGNFDLLPSGILREPLNCLADADIIVLTKCDGVKGLDKTIAAIKKYNRSAILAKAVFKPECFVRVKDGKELSLKTVNCKRVFVFSGIGNPEYFEKTVGDLKPSAAVFVRYLDHHAFTVSDLEFLKIRAKKAAFAVTTEKDAVRLKGKKVPANLLALRIKMKIINNEKALIEAVRSA